MGFNEENFEFRDVLGRNHVLTVKELANYCQISEITVRRALSAGELIGIKFGNTWRIEGQHAREWINSKLNTKA